MSSDVDDATDGPLIAALVAQGWRRLTEGRAADRVLERLLRENPALTSTQRARVARRFLALCVWQGRLRTLSGGDETLLYPLLLVDQASWPAEAAAALGGVDPSLLRDALATPEPDDPAERLALRRSLPLWLAQRWIDQLGLAEADALAEASNRPAPACLRANRLRIDRERLQRRLAKEGVPSRLSDWAPDGLVLLGRGNLFGLDAWREGLFEVQDEASQRAAHRLGVQPDETVVDLCAGSGGKTLALAAAMRLDGTATSGRLIAVDIDGQRLTNQRVRLQRAGVVGVEQRCGDATEGPLLADLDGRCDAVLVDAPCSELGVLRRSPDARWRLQPGEIDRWAALQRRLLARGRRLVRPGGRLLYATCSIDRAENEAVAWPLPSGWSDEGSETLWPHRQGCDGFFAALSRRSR